MPRCGAWYHAVSDDNTGRAGFYSRRCLGGRDILLRSIFSLNTPKSLMVLRLQISAIPARRRSVRRRKAGIPRRFVIQARGNGSAVPNSVTLGFWGQMGMLFRDFVDGLFITSSLMAVMESILMRYYIGPDFQDDMLAVAGLGPGQDDAFESPLWY